VIVEQEMKISEGAGLPLEILFLRLHVSLKNTSQTLSISRVTFGDFISEKPGFLQLGNVAGTGMVARKPLLWLGIENPLGSILISQANPSKASLLFSSPVKVFLFLSS